MKVIIINGQNHKGSTYHIGRMLAEKITDSQNIKEIFLPNDLNHFCLGCYSCINDAAGCPFYEEKKTIEEKMKEADVIIVTSPTYCMEMSAPLKSFFDLFFTYWISHTPREYMFKKKAVVVTTAAGAGVGSALKPILNNLKWWGIPWRKKIGIVVSASCWEEVSEKKMQKIKSKTDKIASAVKNSKPGKPDLFIRMMFNLMGSAKKGSKEGAFDWNEAIYWREKGWLDGVRPWK